MDLRERARFGLGASWLSCVALCWVAEALAAPRMSMNGTEDSVLSKSSEWLATERVLLRLADWLPCILPKPMAAMRLDRIALASAIWSSLSVQTPFRCSICIDVSWKRTANAANPAYLLMIIRKLLFSFL